MAIKRNPGEFLVEELLAGSMAARLRRTPGPFALYRLAKESLTTPDALNALRRALGLSTDAVTYGGLKDRHARTTQHITVPFRPTRLQQRNELEQAQGPGWRIERLGWVDFPITAVAIAANRFRIVVRDLTREADLIEEVARLHGYDKIPILPHVAHAVAGETGARRVRKLLARLLTAAGKDSSATVAEPEASS